MAKRLTKEEFIKKACIENPNYDYSEIEYINGSNPITVSCNNGHYFTMNARSFYHKVNCPECSRLKHEESFIEKAKKIHNDKYIYKDINYINNDIPINITCPIHGIFKQRPSDHLKGYGCSKCSKKYKPTSKEWGEFASSIYNNKYDYSKVEYVDNKTPVLIICHEKDENGVEHGEFYQIPNNHIRGLGGCPKCRSNYKHHLYAKTTEQFIKDSKEIHGDKYDYSKVEYVNNKEKVCIICPEHDEFWQIAGSHLSGAGCPMCLYKSQAKLYEKLKMSFPDEEILFEVGSNVVSWIEKQRFDIYFPKYNIAVEYDGEQHYRPVNIFGGEENFIKVKERDKLKEQKCKENNCNLFRMKYDYDDLQYNKLVENIKNIINSY